MISRFTGAAARFWVASPLGQALLWLLVGGAASVLLGLDDNWDLQNYHLYDPFAFLTGRAALDLNAVGNQSTFFPLVDVPYYLVAVRWLPHFPRIVCFLAGLPCGALGFLVLRVSLATGLAPASAWIATAIGMTGTTVFLEIGTTFGDIPVACCVVAGLWQLLRNVGEEPRWRWGCAGAGAGCGVAFALKLTAVIYIPAILVAILIVGLGWPRKLAGAVVFLVASGVCFLGVYGPWGWHLWVQYGDPLFPFLNNIFHSQWADPSFARATKFLPRSLWRDFFYPFFWLRGRAQVVSETGVRDWHFALAYLSIVAVCLTRRLPDRRVLLLYVFSVSAFALWEVMFSILRYALPLEALTGTIILSALSHTQRHKSFLLLFFKKEDLFFFEKKNQKTFIYFGVGVFAFLLATSGWPGWGRVRHVPETIFDIESENLPDGTSVVVAGEPVGFVIPFITGTDLHFYGINATPHTFLDQVISTRISHAATLRVLMLGGDPQGRQQLERIGIRPDPALCKQIVTHRRIWGPIMLCHVMDRL